MTEDTIEKSSQEPVAIIQSWRDEDLNQGESNKKGKRKGRSGINDKLVITEKNQVNIKNHSSKNTVEIYFCTKS